MKLLQNQPAYDHLETARLNSINQKLDHITKLMDRVLSQALSILNTDPVQKEATP